MTRDSIPPFQLDPGRLDAAARMLARAFDDDPLWQSLLSDNERAGKAGAVFRYLLSHARLRGEVQVTSGRLEGVAIWFAVGQAQTTPVTALRAGGLALAFRLGRSAGRLAAADRYVAGLRERLAPRNGRYCAALGVDPRFQGRGFGGRLLRAMLTRCDVERRTCYLETAREANVGMYRHFGFRVVEQATIPDIGVRLWCLARSPAGTVD